MRIANYLDDKCREYFRRFKNNVEDFKSRVQKNILECSRLYIEGGETDIMFTSEARPESYQTFLEKMSETLNEVDNEYDS